MRESQTLNNFYQSLSDKKWDDTTVYEAFKIHCAWSYDDSYDNKGNFYHFNEGFDFAKTLKEGEKACYLVCVETIYLFKYRKIRDLICKIKRTLNKSLR
jgi:hypothetical protein